MHEGSDALASREENIATPLVLYTDNGLLLRQYSTPEDDTAYLELENANRDHIAEFGNKIYETLEDVRKARLNPELLRLGIWEEDNLIGEVCIASKDGKEAEMGVLLAKDSTGHGYATSALLEATNYAQENYERVFAEVAPDNERSISLLQRAGYVEPSPGEVVQRDWGNALILEAKK